MDQPTLTIKPGSILCDLRCEDMQIAIVSDRLLDENLAEDDQIKQINDLLAELEIKVVRTVFVRCSFATTAMLAKSIADAAIDSAQTAARGTFAKRPLVSWVLPDSAWHYKVDDDAPFKLLGWTDMTKAMQRPL